MLTFQFQTHMTIRHGEIQAASISGLSYVDDIDQPSQDQSVGQALVKQRIHHISDWRETLKSASPIPIANSEPIGRWLNTMFGLAK